MTATSAPSQAIASGVQTPTRLRMSFEEFLKWEHPGIAEWVNGEVDVMSVKLEHQRVVDFLIQLLGIYLRIMGLGVVHSAPFVMRAIPGGSGREPDVMVVTADHLDRLTSDQLVGPADLVVEVISDESVSRDRGDKFYEYQDAGVREYWIIDSRPDRQRADFYVLDANRRYRPVPIADDGTYRSIVLPEFWLNVNWLWVEEPDVLKALAQVVGPDKLIEAIRAAG
jgi:Uma2 family endonuclease